MSKKQLLIDQIQNRAPVIPVYRATVKSVEGNTCTVKLVGSDLEVDEVLLCADKNADSVLIITPKIGSIVLVGLVENDISNLFVIQASEINSIEYRVKSNSVNVTDSTVDIKQGETLVSLDSGKVEVSNSQTSLKEIFSDLATLLQNFKVVTSQGPSTALFADTLTAVTQFKTKYPLLLK